MPEFDNTNRGVLFKNDRKEHDKQPDYTGNGNFDGVDVWISGWIKKPKNGGDKYMSLSFTPKEKQDTPAPSTEDSQGGGLDW